MRHNGLLTHCTCPACETRRVREALTANPHLGTTPTPAEVELARMQRLVDDGIFTKVEVG